MKKVVVLALFAMALTPSIGQEESKERTVDKPKFVTFGFSAGINRSNLSFRDDDRATSDITNGLGYRFGVTSNFRFGNHFSVAPKAELSFNASRLEQDGTSYKMNPLNIELAGHLKYKFLKGTFSPYIIAGPNARIPVNSGSTTFTNKDVAIDLGVGLDVPLFRFRVSPELRYSFGMKEMMEETAFTNIKYHNIALVLIFSGN